MTPEQNKAITRRFVEEALNKRLFGKFDEYVKPDFVEQAAPPDLPKTVEGTRRLEP